jgi:3-phenylpropionate/trans-cinnamate dioxygenase ferredoxin reductase component
MRIVLAGSGLAAHRCAEALRAGGHDGPVVMLSAERHPPYDRPPLSKPGADPLHRLRPAGWYADAGVELRLATPVTGLDPAARQVVLDGGERLPYDRLLIATGADPVVPALFAGLPTAQALRTLDDALRLRAALRPGLRLAVVGAGLVGQEVASMAVMHGVRVTLIDAAARPFDALVGPALGGWLADLHRAAGVELRLGARVVEAGAEWLRLSDGACVACDHMLVGVGVRPAVGWAGGRVADAPGVLLAGDAAGAGHWEAAARQGAAAARAMLGLPARPPVPAVLWSDQHGVRMQRIGDPRDADRTRLDGDPQDRSFTLTYERAGRLVAAVLVDRPGALATLRRRLQAAARPEEMAA